MAEYLYPYHAKLMAAVMTHSNMGHGFPGGGEYSNPRHWFWNSHYMKRDDMSVENAVEWVMGYLAESEDHIDMFISEAKGWIAACEDANKLAADHPHVWRWYVKTVYSERWKHAKICIDGASNQRLVSRTLHKAICDVQDEGGDLKNDAAVLMIQHQLAHLLGQAPIMDLALYTRLEREVHERFAEYESVNTFASSLV